ncbi:glycoside hydrolase family protein [Cypionkella psychrotolerans]|uniref:glycoside hydrolase family protein n=1 Tax=Cypionkella psychrotolerans TaxID=1678131 RepID=UPI0006B4813B|nr:peptidoglycan-binding protein [Cypionkella psychrotolerans]
MQTSAQGVSALELEEGVVLRAYRDSVGVWTVGAGLTAASGVVKPKAGMVITQEQATALLQQALREKYEPAVRAAMTTSTAAPKQYEFDAGVSFHWNLGKISSASWVKAWKSKAPRADIRMRLMLWNKAGGKVLPGLTARRAREADMLLDGKYRTLTLPTPVVGFARWGLILSGAEIAAIRSGFKGLGYDPGSNINAVLETAARKFQADHGLTVDGIIGRATLSTLQRQLDARAKAKTTAVAVATPVAAVTLPTGTSDLADALLQLPHANVVLVAGAALYGVNFLYRYRDAVAVVAQPLLPRVAAFLRSF